MNDWEALLHSHWRQVFEDGACRWFTGTVPPGTPLPFAVLTPISARTTHWTAGHSRVGIARVRLTLRGEGLAELRDRLAHGERGLERLVAADGAITDLFKVAERSRQETDGVWAVSHDYDILWQRSG